SEEGNRDVSSSMADRAEDYLESLLTDAFKGKGFQKLRELLQKGEVEPPQKYSESLLNQLDKALRKELDKNEFENVSLMLKCIQLYLKSDLQEEKSLFIEQGLLAKMNIDNLRIINSSSLFLTHSFNFYMVSWFERTRGFMAIIDPNENKFLMLLLEDFFDSALVICKCSNEGKKELVNLFLPELGHLVTEANLCYALHLEALRTLNSILDSLPREERKKFPLSEEMCSLTQELAKTLLEVGDYDLQVALSEALCRLMIKKWRDDLVHHWFEDNYLAEAFKEIKDREFETDCRKFLNLLNERLGNKRRVYSFPCISAFADMNEVKKPSDEKLEEFWIDFNVGSQCVTFYVDCDEGDLWDSVRLSKENVNSYSMKEKDRKKIVKILMKIPSALGKTEATKIKLIFSAEFEILSVLKKVLGDEKLMVSSNMEAASVSSEQGDVLESGVLLSPSGVDDALGDAWSCCGRTAWGSRSAQLQSLFVGKGEQQPSSCAGEIPVSSNAQRRTDPSNSEDVEAQKDNLTSQHSQQVTGTVAAKGKTIISLPSSEKKSKTPSPRMKAKPSRKRNRRASLAKKRAGGRKDPYDFENSDSSSHGKVAAAKGKILGQNIFSQSQRTYETRSKSKESNSLERRQPSYRKHLFSESNNENTSTGQSEKSWILDSQIQLVPKHVDYTRKRPRVRSKLKVLPMSSASSGSDYESKKEGASRQRAQKEMLREKSTFSFKEHGGSTVDLAEGLGFIFCVIKLRFPVNAGFKLECLCHLLVSPTDEMLSEEPGGSPLLLSVPAKSPSSDVEKATQVQGTCSVDILSSTVTKKPKFSSLEENDLPSETSHTAKEISDLVEEEVKIQKSQEMDDSLDDVFLSEMPPEDLSDSGVVSAFESFIGQVKNFFWARYKRMEIDAQNALRSSERNLSALLNQIHQCRLKKLETFEKIVVEELANLEKETQILADMEKDALDFWNAQLLRLNAFCNRQKQRIESVDSALGETAKSFADAAHNT
ncbi:SYC2L protein, partial [Rhipidura dahli]|nr:SYC2L protein [Rhipidura dahli]